MGKNQEVGQVSKKWKAGEFLAKMGMNILLVMIIGISVALCVGSFYLDELFMGFEAPLKRIGMQVLAILAVTLYTEFVYQIIFAKWTYRAGVGTIFALCVFLVFMVLGFITFAVFLWYSLEQWIALGLVSIGFLPVVLSILLFVVFFLRRIMEV